MSLSLRMLTTGVLYTAAKVPFYTYRASLTASPSDRINFNRNLIALSSQNKLTAAFRGEKGRSEQTANCRTEVCTLLQVAVRRDNGRDTGEVDLPSALTLFIRLHHSFLFDKII